MHVKSKQKLNIFKNDVSKELFTSKEGQDSISSTRYKNLESMQQKLWKQNTIKRTNI